MHLLSEVVLELEFHEPMGIIVGERFELSGHRILISLKSDLTHRDITMIKTI